MRGVRQRNHRPVTYSRSSRNRSSSQTNHTSDPPTSNDLCVQREDPRDTGSPGHHNYTAGRSGNESNGPSMNTRSPRATTSQIATRTSSNARADAISPSSKRQGGKRGQKKRRKLIHEHDASPPDVARSPDGCTDPSSDVPFNESCVIEASSNAITPRGASTRRRMVDSLSVIESSTDSTADAPTMSMGLNSFGSEDFPGDGHRPTVSSAHPKGPSVTYARQRSLLNDHPVFSHGGSCSLASDPSGSHPLKRQPKPDVHAQPHADPEDDNDSGLVRGIHELRQAGENARFRGTVDSILEDIEEACASESDPCNGFIHLCTKLLDPQSARRFADGRFEKRLLRCATGNLDTTSASFALCAYELARSGGLSSPISLARFRSELLRLTSALLVLDTDVPSMAEHRGSIGSTARDLRSRLTSILYGNESLSRVSPRILALRCIQSILFHCQETNSDLDILPAAVLDSLVSLLVREIPDSKDFPLQTEPYQVLLSTLSTLEAYTVLLGQRVPGDQSVHHSLSRLPNLLNVNTRDGSHHQHWQISLFYLRLVLNVTDSNPSLCSDFATPMLVGGLVNLVDSEFNEAAQGSASDGDWLDVVILALGTLVNLAEGCESSRSLFLESTSNSVSLLDSLLRHYLGRISFVAEVSSSGYMCDHHLMVH